MGQKKEEEKKKDSENHVITRWMRCRVLFISPSSKRIITFSMKLVISLCGLLASVFLRYTVFRFLFKMTSAQTKKWIFLRLPPYPPDIIINERRAYYYFPSSSMYNFFYVEWFQSKRLHCAQFVSIHQNYTVSVSLVANGENYAFIMSWIMAREISFVFLILS